MAPAQKRRFNSHALTHRQRAFSLSATNGERVGVRCRFRSRPTFFDHYASETREILNDLLEKYAIDGELQFTLPDVLKVAPVWRHGNVAEIVRKFGGTDLLRGAVKELQIMLYAA